jgi:large subunit ribosomal protein L21
MYAIVEVSGKQYRVQQGDEIIVDRLDSDEGKSITLMPLLLGGEKKAVSAAELKGVKVKAKVSEHMLGDKIRVFTYKPKRGYKKMKGHRSRLSRLTIESISAGAKKKAEKPEETPAKDSAAETA